MKRLRISLFSRKLLIASLISLTGLLVNLTGSINLASSQHSIIDKGLILYNGALFANNICHPFQDYGPRTLFGPLSYLIPGYKQLWFGPGLRTGRTFSIIVGILALVELWITARRLTGNWWAAADEIPA